MYTQQCDIWPPLQDKLLTDSGLKDDHWNTETEVFHGCRILVIQGNSGINSHWRMQRASACALLGLAMRACGGWCYRSPHNDMADVQSCVFEEISKSIFSAAVSCFAPSSFVRGHFWIGLKFKILLYVNCPFHCPLSKHATLQTYQLEHLSMPWFILPLFLIVNSQTWITGSKLSLNSTFLMHLFDCIQCWVCCFTFGSFGFVSGSRLTV